MYKVGVDLGGTNIVAGIVNDELKIIGRGRRKTNLPRTADEIFDDIALAVKLAAEDAGISMDEISNIGIGTPGSYNKDTGYIEFSNNLAFKQVPAKQILEEKTGKTCCFDNDANCAALGEAYAGAGKGVKNLVAITLGTGVGSGVIVDGKIVSGGNFCAGEIGHTVIMVDGVQCNCGRKGCWEKYASATALVSQTKEAMQADPESSMWDIVGGDINKVNGLTSFDAARAGDKTAQGVVDRYIYYVSVGVTNIINALQPDVLCVGGGIGHEGENLLIPLRKHVENERYSIYAKNQTIICSAEIGNDAGIIGAALLD